MGRLVGLELHNFKSYRGTTSVGFGTSFFTSIIGPNGSGKSNMMDAISFVLGVRSNHLRSTHLNDLIYRGKIMLEGAGDKSDIGSSSDDDVDDELEGVKDDDVHERDSKKKSSDPVKAYVLCIYERSNGDILKLKRSITKNGSSEYRVNNKVVSASDYASILKKENILIKARNFLVFQGDVEQIASQSAADLTKLIETISGSIDFKKEFDQLKEDQELANEQTKSIFSTRRTLNGELKQYKEQCLELESFEKKINERLNLVRLSKIYELYHTEKEITTLTEKLSKYKKELKTCKIDLKNEESAFKKISAEYAKYELKLNKYKKKITSTTKDLDEKQRDLIPLNTEKSLLLNKLNDYQLRIKEINKDILRQNSNIQDINKQLHIVVESKKVFEEKLQQETTIKLSQEALKRYQQLRESFLMKGGAEEENVLNNLNHEKELLDNQLENHESTKNATSEFLKNLELDLNDLNRLLTDLTSNLNNKLDQLSLQKQQLSNIRDLKKLFLDQEFELNTKLKEVLIQINDLNANQRESNRERKLRENVSTLRRLFPSVKGLVSDLCRPTQKRYELAVSTILGKNFDSIVVDNLSVASKCIEYLKEQRAGVATFIPLDSVESKPPASHLRHVHELAKPSIDCLEYDSTLERAIQYCCGNSMICEDMNVAKYIRWESKIDVKVVTLDGSLIHKAGLMTGGKSKQEGRKFNKNELNSLQDLKLNLMKQIDDLKKQLPNETAEKKLMNGIDALEEDLSQLRRNRVQLQREVADKDSHAKIQRENLESINAKIGELQEQLSSKSQQILDQEQKISGTQHDIYDEFCLENGLSSINEYENSFKNSTKYKQKTQFLKQISVLENKLIFENERVEESNVRLDKLNREKLRLEEKLTSLNDQLHSKFETIELVESELELLKEELATFESKYQENFKQSNVSNTRLEEIKLEISNKKSKVDEINENLLKELNNKLQILKNCKIENVDIPIFSGSIDDVPIDIVAEDEEEEIRLLDLARSIEIEFDDLPQEYTEKSDDTSKEFQNRIESLQEDLESLTPNTKAIERLREVESKLSTIEREFKQKRQEEQKIVNKFNELKQKRYSKFNEAFEHISQNIDDIYKELTKSPASPLGGSLYLTLEDEDEPYNAGIKYHAMPPMKRFRDMEFLSGGEKTIAALALLFAIHSYHPSPFFVLDEVDAALDNSNVNKLANYIKNNCNENFQFIVISLKNSLFEKSDSLIGIFRKQEENSSKTVTLDLRSYPERA